MYLFASSLAKALFGEGPDPARRSGRVRMDGLFDQPTGSHDLQNSWL